MCLGSSPGTYSRCSANSTEKPWNGLLWRPVTEPSTTRRAMMSSREIFWSVFGSRKRRAASALGFAKDRLPRLDGDAGSRGGVGRLHVLEELLDDLVRRDALCLGVEVRDDPVPEDGLRDRGHVLGRDVVA